jgi:hypothetical protein
MRTLALTSLLVVLIACSSGPRTGATATPGHGAITVEVVPNPIVATRADTNRYSFPFEVVIRETGGHTVNVERVSVRVWGMGDTIVLGEEQWDAAEIRNLGYSTTVAANSEVRLKFSPQRAVPDDRLFNGITAELVVQATDETGTSTSASTKVTVTRT